jgi:hypothetical protein
VVVILFVIASILRIATGNHRPTTTKPVAAFHPTVDQKRLDDILRAQREMVQRPIIVPPVVPGPMVPVPANDPPANDPHRLHKDDVPLLAGLCYRIDRESRQRGPAPGKKICEVLDRPGRDLLRRAADGADLGGQADDLLEALNEVLDSSNLYDAAAFAGFWMPAEAGILQFGGAAAKDLPPGVLLRANRALLEAAYPQQILPARLPRPLTERDRMVYDLAAHADLAEARRKYEGK